MKRTNRFIPAGWCFTLIELLVVVAIIAVLVAIMLPALQAAKNAANVAVCGSDLRQNGISLAQYASDFYGLYPRTDYNYNTIQFHTINVAGCEGSLWYLWRAGYVPQPKSWYCPSSTIVFEQNWEPNPYTGNWQPKWGGPASSYQYRIRVAYYARPDHCLKPEDFPGITVYVDAFQTGAFPRPNHRGGQWNCLLTDGSVQTRYDSAKIIPALWVDWPADGDYLQWGYPFQNIARLWHWFDGLGW